MTDPMEPLQEKVNDVLHRAETVKEGQALPVTYVLGYEPLQDTADRLGEVVVQGHYSYGKVVSTDVYWPSGKDYTLVSKDALKLLISQVMGATWHEGQA